MLFRINADQYSIIQMPIIESAALCCLVVISCVYCQQIASDVGQSHYSGKKTESNSFLMKSQNSDDNSAILSSELASSNCISKHHNFPISQRRCVRLTVRCDSVTLCWIFESLKLLGSEFLERKRENRTNFCHDSATSVSRHCVSHYGVIRALLSTPNGKIIAWCGYNLHVSRV
jgi:hypothetical protein